MPKRIHKTSAHHDERRFGKHRFEHWYVDNQVYFITARCRDRYPAFAADDAKRVFWDRFEHWTRACGLVPWVASLLDNHYHLLGYNRTAEGLKTLMPRLHGSVAKLVNDLLPHRRTDFWRDNKGKEFFDGCIRDPRQARLAYRYVRTQCRRHGICAEPHDYPHTRVYLDCERSIRRALELNAFMLDVPYHRYDRGADQNGQKPI